MLRVAQARSYALVAQDAAARSAREMAVAAERLPNPMLRLSVDNLPVDGPVRYSLTDDFITMRSIGVTQTLTRADKRRARAARFEREADTAQAARAHAPGRHERGADPVGRVERPGAGPADDPRADRRRRHRNWSRAKA